MAGKAGTHVTGTAAGEPVSDDRRLQILYAAVEVLRERGFPETRVADVAKRAEVSSALVMYYFESKDQLLTAALRLSEERFFSSASEALATLSSAQARLEHLVRVSVLPDGVAGAGHSSDLMDSWVLWLDIWAQAYRHSGVARDRYELDQRWRDMVAEVVRDGQQAGEFRDAAVGLDADEFATWFTALLDGLIIQVILSDPVVSAGRAFELAMRVASDQLGFAWSNRHRGTARRTPARRTGTARRTRSTRG
jgi:AcrR family transcriptional regulator